MGQLELEKQQATRAELKRAKVALKAAKALPYLPDCGELVAIKLAQREVAYWQRIVGEMVLFAA